MDRRLALLPVAPLVLACAAGSAEVRRARNASALPAAAAPDAHEAPEASVARVASVTRVERAVAAMGTVLSLEVEAPDRPTALAASEAAVRAVEAVEARLSTWTEESELARLNRAPVGAPVELSPELASDLARASELHRLTAGAFDPTLGALVQAWGLRSGGRIPSANELAAARAACGLDGLELTGSTARRLRPGLMLEEGGFGKGVGLDAALVALRDAGAHAALLDLGGQVALLPGGAPRWIGIAHPRERDTVVLEALVDAGSLSTSGNSERGLVVGGETVGHLLDPRTGRPAPDFGSLTVWASDATRADALSKLFVLGPQGALEWAARHDDALVVVVEQAQGELRVGASAGWRGRLRGAEGFRDLEVRFVPFRPGETTVAAGGRP